MATNLIYNLAKLSRPVSFSGLPHVGSCSPTDIDAPPIPFCIEVGNMKRFLVGDFKEHGKYLECGQLLLFERIVNAMAKDGYVSAAFLAWHHAADEVIDAAESVVVRSYYEGRWIEHEKRQRLVVLYKKFFIIP